MTKLLSEDIEKQIQELFAGLEQPVRILYFGTEENCEYCDDTRQMVEEIASLSDMLSLVVYDIEKDSGIAQQFKVDKAPGLVLAGLEGEQVLDYGVRFAGIPAGHEFSSLIHDLVQVSKRQSGLSEQSQNVLKGLSQPILLQVFVTPT